MATDHDLLLGTYASGIDLPCPGCGQAYQYRPSMGWIMLGPCDRCAEGIPGTGIWGRNEDGRPQWKLNDGDEWRTLTLSQLRVKGAEERAAIEAASRRRRQN